MEKKDDVLLSDEDREEFFVDALRGFLRAPPGDLAGVEFSMSQNAVSGYQFVVRFVSAGRELEGLVQQYVDAQSADEDGGDA